MIINENKKLRLKTKNKYCTDDIDIIVNVPETANPYIATTTTEMAQYLASKYDGAVVKYTGTSGTYTNGTLYKVYAVSSNEWTFKELITPVGSTTITENNTYDVKEYASVVVNVPSGGAKLNIAYGDTAPEDISKLWVKTNITPTKTSIVKNFPDGNVGINTGIASLPTAAYGIASATVGTKIYLFGGKGNSGADYFTTINVFDTESNTITTLSTTLPTGAYSIASAVVGTKVYLFGGNINGSGSSTRLSTINVFDTKTNTITTLSTKLPTAAYGIASAVVGTKVYLFGGSYYLSGGKELSTINVFDTESNTITTLSTTLPTAAYGIASATVGTKIYLFGGGRSSGSPYALSTINVFDTETNTITKLSTTLPTATYSIASAVVGTKVYLFGGNSTISTINVFDTETNTITTLSTTLPTGSNSIASAVIGPKVYLFGGYPILSTINLFVVALSIAENNLLLKQDFTKAPFNLISTDEAEVQMSLGDAYIGNSSGEGEQVKIAIHNGSSWEELN